MSSAYLSSKQKTLQEFPDARCTRDESSYSVTSKQFAILFGTEELGWSGIAASAWDDAWLKLRRLRGFQIDSDSGERRRDQRYNLVTGVRDLNDPLDAELQADLLRVLHKYGVRSGRYE